MKTSIQRLKAKFSEYFKEVIYGGIDGVVTTFAVVAGFAGAAITNSEATQLSFVIVLLFGLANLFADAASMGLGNFLSVRSEKGLYEAVRKKEMVKLNTDATAEIQVTVNLLKERGFDEENAQTLAVIYSQNQEYWMDFLLQNREEMTDPRGENEIFTGLATFISFMIFGAIPLLPFMLQESGDPATAFLFSSVGTFIGLITLGLLKWRVIGDKLVASLTEVILVGGTAAMLAYFVGTFFAI